MLHAPIADYKRGSYAGGAKKKVRHGASRSPAKTPGIFSLTYLAKLFAAAATAAAITAALVWFDPKEKISRVSSKPISQVQLEGEFKFIDKTAASELITKLIDGSFLDLNISTLKQKIEQHPWIDSVIITRRWPDKLKVRVIEQQPIAQWGEKSFLNMKGDVVEIENTAKINTLPKLSGSDVFAKEIMQHYLQMNKAISQSGLALKSVDMDATGAWQVQLNNNVLVKLGSTNALQKLQTLAKVSQTKIKEDFNNIRSIDMRYHSGFAVEWKNTTANYMAER